MNPNIPLLWKPGHPMDTKAEDVVGCEKGDTENRVGRDRQ